MSNTKPRTYWMDCPIHGTKEYPNSGNFDNGLAYCFDCKDFTAQARTIIISKVKDNFDATCDSRCLNGKKSCGCHCRGACHGQPNCNPELH